MPLWARASWCNGAAGRILLWVRAFEATGDARYLDRATRDAHVLPPHLGAGVHDLCCGAPGWAYACLALERIQPHAGWRERARDYALAVVRAALDFTHPSGLLKGLSGIVFLVADLLRNGPCGFPFIEAVPGAPGQRKVPR
jgi:hypothetical protein